MAGAVRAATAAALLALLAACGPSGSGLSSFGSRGSAGPVGPICGERAIVGQVVPRVDGRGACGIRRPVKIHSVHGVALSPQPTLTCETAGALSAWVESAAKPEVARTGQSLAGLDVAADYACRRRNSAWRGELSEHAHGRAIDISGFRMADGTTVSVAEHWSGSAHSEMLKRIHAAGCGPFGTTLGPGSDGYHEDHFHYDVARHENGPYCR
jgi:hypothetical protein